MQPLSIIFVASFQNQIIDKIPNTCYYSNLNRIKPFNPPNKFQNQVYKSSRFDFLEEDWGMDEDDEDDLILPKGVRISNEDDIIGKEGEPSAKLNVEVDHTYQYTDDEKFMFDDIEDNNNVVIEEEEDIVTEEDYHQATSDLSEQDFNDDLDEVVEVYYNPVTNKLTEKRLSEKQKQKIRMQREAAQLYAEKQKIRTQKRKALEARLVASRKKRLEKEEEVKQNKKVRKQNKLNMFKEKAFKEAEKILLDDYKHDNENKNIIDTKRVKPLADALFRKELILYEMEEEAKIRASEFIEKTQALGFISNNSALIPRNGIQLLQTTRESFDDDGNGNGDATSDFTADVMAFRNKELQRKKLIVSVALSKSFNHNDVELLSDADLNRVLIIRGRVGGSSKASENKRKKRSSLIEKLQDSYKRPLF